MNKVIFCGYGELGKNCLIELLNNGYEIVYILTHKELKSSSVDTFARSNHINYSYKDSRKHLSQMMNVFKSSSPHFLISVNYRYILPKDIFEIPYFSINIHGSLLPKYRGRTPHVWSIINGEKESGITCHFIEESVDTGDIIEQLIIPILKNDTGYSLLKRFEKLYPQVLTNSLLKLKLGDVITKQNNKLASYYGKRTPDMGYIDFYKCGNEIFDFVRAQSKPYPGAYYFLIDGKKIIVHKIDVYKHTIDLPMIGVIYNIDNELLVKCKDSVIIITEFEIL